MVGRLDGKVAIVTGSTSGIGRETARQFALQGAKVVANGRRQELGDSLVAEIRAAGGTAEFYCADLTESAAVRGLVRFAVETYGRLDVLMNNAYFPVMGTATELSEADWDRAISILLRAPFVAIQEAIPQMAAQGGGSIINVSSVHGFFASNRFHVYDTAKAGLINMTRSIALDYGRQGIRANAICPGFIATERSQAHFREHPERARGAALVYPIGRFGQPIDIANAAVYLASDESSFVTGTTLMVDGGMTCQLPDTLYGNFASYYREEFAREWGIDPDKPAE